MTKQPQNTGASVDARLDQFFQAFSVLRQERIGRNQARLASFLDEFRVASRDGFSPEAFNILQILGVGDDEVRHSSILAWLVDPSSRHGYGPILLGSLLEVASIPYEKEWLDKVKVYTEFPGHESIIDILISCPPNFILYLENKIWSGEGPDQLARERRDLRRLAEPVQGF